MSSRVFVQDGQTIPVPFINDLIQDIILAEDRVEATMSPTASRDFVRAAFALNEGLLDWFRGLVSKWLVGRMLRYDELQIAKLYMIGTVTHRLSKQGKLETEAARRSFINDLAFVIRTGAECWHLDPTKFFSDVGWDQTQKALKVRHRVTHPKRKDDLYISTEELELVRESMRWVLWSTGVIIRYADNADMDYIDSKNGVVKSDLHDILSP